MQITELVARQRAYFESGATRPLAFRRAALGRLYDAIVRMEPALFQALRQDLNKSPQEAYMTEIGLTLSEIRYQKKHLRAFARTRRVPSPLSQFHAKSFIVREPYGVALIMSPWNYPLMLLLEPLAAAIAAGNCCVLKPSAYAPATSAVLAKLIAETFEDRFVAVVEGGRAENTALLDEPFDYIFFTGGQTVGRFVMEKAAAHLTPVTLELGGKSPCIVDRTANLKLAARRIAFGKFLNSGQTCVAPDYALVEQSVVQPFLEHLRRETVQMLGDDPLSNPDYPKMINRRHFDRVCGLLEGQTAVFGGHADEATLRIAPTVLYPVQPDSAVMGEEIFGPVLPVLSYQSLDEAIAFVRSRPRPLALYVFTGDRETERRVLGTLPYGGGCVNDTIIHLATSRMPFGGVGASGMGNYHGKYGFDTFTHEKSVVKKYTWIDLPMRYQPYSAGKLAMIRRFLR